jgi:hypothetical protein
LEINSNKSFIIFNIPVIILLMNLDVLVQFCFTPFNKKKFI